MNPIYGTIGWFAGSRWNNSDMTPAGSRLSFARGALQLFSSSLTATGLASFILFATAQGATLAWSWPLWTGCVIAVLLFDAAFNIVLNLVTGVPYFSLLLARVGLTLVMAQFTAQTLTMMWSQHGLKPIAQQLASAEFDKSLKSLSDERAAAEASAKEAREKLSAFETALNSTSAPATIPATCNNASNASHSDDPLIRANQQRAERQRQARCNQLFGQVLDSEKKRQQGSDSLRATLQAASSSAETRLTTAQAAFASQDAGRREAVKALASNIGIQAAALDKLKSTNAGTQALFVALLTFIMFVELLSVYVKFITSRIDESSNREAAEISRAATDYSQDRYVSDLMQEARRTADRSKLVDEARDNFNKQAAGTMAAHHAGCMSQATRRRLRGQLGTAD